MQQTTINLTEVRTKWALAKSAKVTEAAIAAINADLAAGKITKEEADIKIAKVGSPVIVLPAFDEDGTIMDTAVTTSGTKGWGYVQLFQQANSYDWKQGAMYDNNRWALLRANAASLEARFKPGQVLTGNILIIDTLVEPNPANLAQDLRYTRREIYDMVAQGNTSAVPCKVGGKPVYRVRRWEPTGTEKDITIEHTNQAEIDQWYASVTKSLNKPNSSAIHNAGKAALAGKVTPEQMEAELDELMAIRAGKRTPEQKARIAELEEMLAEA